MRIQSFKIMNNDKFRNAITISFETNKRRKDNEHFLFENTNISKWTIALGKNSSGKSSIYRVMLSYFMLFDINYSFNDNKPNDNKPKDNKHKDFSKINIFRTTNDVLSDYPFATQESINFFKPSKNEKIYNEYLKNPSYEVIYITKDNTKIIHKVFVSRVSLKEQISLSQSLHDFKKMSIMFREKDVNKLTNAINDSSKTSYSSNYLKEIFSFIHTTLRTSDDSNVTWRETVDKTLSEYGEDLSNKKEDFFELLRSVLKSADPNFQELNFQRGVRFKINIGEKLKLISINKLSIGTRRIIYLVIQIFKIASSKHGGLFINDEIDLHINKQLIWELILKTIEYENFQGFATSHSPTIFDNKFRYDSLYEILNDYGVISVNTFAGKYKLRNDKKISNFFDLNIGTSPEEIE